MPNINVTTRDGTHHLFTGDPGLSVMEIIRDNGIDEILALCGGCCSCATCHVYVDPDFMSLLGAITDEESDLLEGSSYRRSTSRLSCQIVVDSKLDNLGITIAPEE